jgi:hypothetical protein
MRRMSPLLLLSFALVAVPLAQEPTSPEAAAEPKRGLVLNAEGAYPGYTLFPPLRSRKTYLVDMQGEVVHTWDSEHSPGNAVYLFPGGTILRCARTQNPVFSGGGQGGRIQELAWDGTVTWDFLFSDETKMHHHDIEPLPNGNVLLIAWERMTAEEAVAAGRDPEQVAENGFWPDFLVEIEPQRAEDGKGGGKIVWEWHAKDHLIQDFDASKANYGDVTAHPELVDINMDQRREPPMSEADKQKQAELEKEMRALGYVGDDEEEDEPRPADGQGAQGGRRRSGDWMHTNSVDYQAEYDFIALSVHNLHEVWILDHSTTTEEARGHTGGRWRRGGDILWRWGNPAGYGQGERSDRALFGQHDASFIPGAKPGELRLLVFNNGGGRPGGDFSSVDELVLPFEPERGFVRAPDAAFGPTEPVWSYSDREGGFFSSFISGAQRLPNGNTLIISGTQGRIFEVTPDKRVVWDYLNPFGGETPLMAGGGPPGDGPRGPPPEGPGGRGPGGRPSGAGPGGPPGDGPGGREGGRGPGGMTPTGLFRAERIPLDHPALAALKEKQ